MLSKWDDWVKQMTWAYEGNDDPTGRRLKPLQLGLLGQAARLLAFFGGLITVYYLKERR